MKVTIEMERGQLQELSLLVGDRMASLSEQKGLTARERAILTAHYENLRRVLRPVTAERVKGASV